MAAVSDDDNDAGFPADLDDFEDIGEHLSCQIINVFACISLAGHEDCWGQYLMSWCCQSTSADMSNLCHGYLFWTVLCNARTVSVRT